MIFGGADKTWYFFSRQLASPFKISEFRKGQGEECTVLKLHNHNHSTKIVQTNRKEILKGRPLAKILHHCSSKAALRPE